MTDKHDDQCDGIHPDELAEKLVPDAAHPDVRKLSGFLLGKSQREDCWRLYLNADFNHYVEFRKADTIHAQQLQAGGTVVWVKAKTDVQETRTRSGEVEFLRGELLREHLAQGRNVGSFAALRQMMGVAAAGCSPSTDERTCQTGCEFTRSPFCNETTNFTCHC